MTTRSSNLNQRASTARLESRTRRNSIVSALRASQRRNSLPTEIWAEVVNFLDIDSMLALTTTCKEFQEVQGYVRSLLIAPTIRPTSFEWISKFVLLDSLAIDVGISHLLFHLIF